MSDTPKIKTRTFVGVWYPDEDLSHMFALNILNEYGFQYCAINHDKDTYSSEDDIPEGKQIGDLKKSHTHVYIRFRSARFLDAVAKELKIAPNYLEPCRNSVGALLYMIHDGYPSKYQYSPEDVYGPLSCEVKKSKTMEDEGLRVLRILEILDSFDKHIVTYRDFLTAVCKAGLYSDFRKLGAGAKYLLDERNLGDYANLPN